MSLREKKKPDLDAEFAEFESLIGNISESKKEKPEETKKTKFEEIKMVKTISAEPTYNVASMLQPTNYAGERRIKKPNFETTENNSTTTATQSAKDKKRAIRKVGDETWTDESMADWPDNDFRIFVGNLGNDVHDNLLTETFSKYPSFAKAKVIRDKSTSKSKGYGFVSYLDGEDFLKAMMEFDGKYIGSRPCKLKKSTWEDRNPDAQKKKKKKKFEFN